MPGKMFSLDFISLKNAVPGMYDIVYHSWREWRAANKKGYDKKRLLDNMDTIIHLIDTKNYRIDVSVNYYSFSSGDGTITEKHIPLLKACGISDHLDPLDVFLAFEEYFSLKRTSSERVEAIGTTNNDKIEYHGFDVKTSFRGKK